ncbi:MAG: hypothetical protein U0768_17590 [Anaerolineae bacterium]
MGLTPTAFQAFLFGAFVQSMLVIAGLLVYWLKVPTRVVGWLAGYGAGALIGAIAFTLIEQAIQLGPWEMLLWLLIGAGIFIAGDRLIERRFGESAGALGIVLGSLVDGVPESIIFGIQLAMGGAFSPAFVTAVVISNIPQSLAPSADLAKAGWSMWRVAKMWLVVVLACGVTCALFYLLAAVFPSIAGDRASAIAGGGLLAMITASFIPFGTERGGIWTGLFTVLGFAFSFIQSQ